MDQTSLLKKYIAILAVLIAGSIAGFFYWRVSVHQINYIIPGVPSFHLYSGTELSSDTEAIAAIILRYWGDERLTFKDINRELHDGGKTLEKMASFFSRQGYAVEITEENTLDDFSEYIRQNIPLIVIRDMSDRLQEKPIAWIYAYTVLIGIEGAKKELIFHNYFYGNNERVSFLAFDRSRQTVKKRFLVIRPSSSIENVLKPAQKHIPYPARLAIMDSPDMRDFTLKRVELELAATKNLAYPETLLKRWQALIDHPAFAHVHPYEKIRVYAYLAQTNRTLGNFNEALRIIQEMALPLNHDLNASYNGWLRDHTLPDPSVLPWISLERTYVAMRDYKNAKVAIDKALAIYPDDLRTQADLAQINALLRSQTK